MGGEGKGNWRARAVGRACVRPPARPRCRWYDFPKSVHTALFLVGIPCLICSWRPELGRTVYSGIYSALVSSFLKRKKKS